MAVHGSPDCEWSLCLAIVQACSWCSWLSSLWVATVPCHSSCLFMMPVLGSLGCEWLLCISIVYASSWCLFLALQEVSGYHALPCFMPFYDTCFWFSREWVATVPCHSSYLFMMPVLGFSACEWLLCLAIIHACSWCLFLGSSESEWLLCLAIVYACLWCLFLALQEVSGYCASL